MAVELGDDELDTRSRRTTRTSMNTSARRSDDRVWTPRRRLSDGGAAPAPRRNFGTSFSLAPQDTPAGSGAVIDDSDKENNPSASFGPTKFDLLWRL